MKITTFVKSLNKFFSSYLINERGCSPCTIETYRYAFTQYITFLETEKNIIPENIEIKDISKSNIESFLLWLEKNQKVSIATRNLRLAAFKCFASFLKYQYPEYIYESVQIQNIRAKKCQEGNISFLKPEGIRLLLSQISQSSPSGRRDYTMILLMYTTGIRVSELIGIRGKDISLTSPKTLIVHGKGNKSRYIAIVKQMVPILERYLNENKCLNPNNIDKYIFLNHSGEKFTRQGINYLLSKYAAKARTVNQNLIPEDCSPHKIRHSTAMTLVEQGTDLIIIRDLLGHCSVQTTEIYAKVSTAKKRQAIETASKQLVNDEDAIWESNSSIKEWLKNLGKHNIM